MQRAYTTNNNNNLLDVDVEQKEDPLTQTQLLMEAETYPSNGQLREAKMSVDEWLQDRRFIRLDNNKIQSQLRFFDTDSSIRTATQIYYSMLFSGGIAFERSHYKLQVVSQQWYNSTWVGWCHGVDRMNASIGFAPCVKQPHGFYVGVPVCLNLARIIILYRLDVYGFPHFVFLEQPEGLQLLPRYIPDVVVYYESLPTATGEFRSKISTLQFDLELEGMLFESALTAVRLRANPTLFLQENTKKHDPESLLSALNPMADSVLFGDGTGAYSDGESNMRAEANRAEEEQDERRRYQYSRMVSMLGPAGLQRVENVTKQWIKAMSAQGHKEHFLPPNRVLASQQNAECPDDLLINFRIARMERILNCFGIPLGMISQTSSLGGGEKQSQNQEVFTIFVHTQKQKKEQLLGFMYDMYSRIYQVHHVMQRLKDVGKGQAHQVTPKADVLIRMNNLPEDALLDNLYKMGALKYEAYTRYMGEKHGIPQEDFNEECELSLKDANGIKEEPTGGAAAAGSSSAKPKSKSSPKK
jgi:hypothetical protein